MKYFLPVALFILAALSACSPRLNVDRQLRYCAAQAGKTLAAIPPDDTLLPRTIDKGQISWHYVPVRDWTSGFWPGTLWYLYEYSGEGKWETEAIRFSQLLTPLSKRPGFDHDLGFQVYNSIGKGYRLTQNADYKAIVLRTADSLATLFNPKVGTILSWPGRKKEPGWAHHTIIDNMMNLELLFWASKNSGSKSLYDIAVRHAETTMRNHFRPDYSAYHVILYDEKTGQKIKGRTQQGYGDETMWARGQAWAIYGFTMTYRETRKPEFLDFAKKIADVYLRRLPEDLVPFWDFDAPNIPNEPKDASAAAISASALLELSTLMEDKSAAKNYRKKAEAILKTLSTAQYQSRERNSAFLLHATGHKPAGSEIDVSIIYGDYYYLEALLRLKKLQENKSF